MADTQQTIATAAQPAAVFAERLPAERRDLFIALPERVREDLVADMDREQLRAFVRRLDPDEASDVLGFLVFLGLAQVVSL